MDDEPEPALAELAAIDGSQTLALKSSMMAEVNRRRSQALLDYIARWEAEAGTLDHDHLDWADEVLDRQGVPR